MARRAPVRCGKWPARVSSLGRPRTNYEFIRCFCQKALWLEFGVIFGVNNLARANNTGDRACHAPNRARILWPDCHLRLWQELPGDPQNGSSRVTAA